MVTGEINDETLKALCWVADSQILFTVCGSRFFGDAHDNSDFDFAIQDRPLLIEELTAAEFVEIWDEDDKRYADGNTVTVYQRGGVQIIITADLKRRVRARQHIRKNALNRRDVTVWEDFYQNNP